ncbi:MAG: hypothetical protein ACYTG3_16740 [Planctomycetota bacterium]
MWFVVGGAVLLGLILLTWFGRWGARWGATADELAMALPGDEWLAGGSPMHLRMTRGAWIEAPAEQVWPWVAQAGRGAGWYSYDRLDNGGRRSARHIVSWIPEPRPGDAAPIGYLRHVVPGCELAWWIGGGRFWGAYLRGVMLYRVTGDGTRARLLVRIQVDARGLLARPACWLLRVIDTLMARRQILGIRERAERYGARREDPGSPESGARDQFQLYHAIYAGGEEVGVPGKEDAPRWRRAAIEDGVIAGVVG